MRVKYPRTYHVPFSPGATSDDKTLGSLAHLEGRECVITTKMDGENTTLYRDGFHARSIDSRHHPSRDWLARFHANIGYLIPEGWRVCGENLWARHSIAYTDLPSYFLGFSVWDENNRALSWDETQLVFEELGIQSVPVKYRGAFSEAHLRLLVAELDLEREEGLVVRVAGEFDYKDFSTSVAKWVRKGHVQTDSHWMHSALVPNQLMASASPYDSATQRRSPRACGSDQDKS
ncbi:RNA ligase family protein [Burkholderia multivorans]|uniref:RNA ligase family protein n=1 Tax=Burkholderia multivorans TaxID=87883 RepID=UPI001C22F51C|nr:RNA ligase family protein [Burkholderia multivorans]MBU9200235.1 RNA ligase family protein [Burkholderia multivorans]MDN8078638.1 RNA ligase family protein [Burkholderia multivorans]